mgnify:CR=1 FL=1
MGYNNYNNNGNYRYAGSGSFSRQPYAYSGQRSYGRRSSGYQNQSGKKHSGCKSGILARGKHAGSKYVSGWNYSKGAGLVSFLAAPYKRSKIVESKSGRKWGTWVIKITNMRTRMSEVRPCLYDMASGRVICKALGIVMNPSKNYCGRYYRTKN